MCSFSIPLDCLPSQFPPQTARQQIAYAKWSTEYTRALELAALAGDRNLEKYTREPAPHRLPAARLTFQGSLVTVKCPHVERPGASGGKRGKVTVFSRASRSRLLRKFASLDIMTAGKCTSFITLTYPREFPSPQDAKQHLRAFLERLRRRDSNCSAVWRMEFQERGAPHFHLIVFNVVFIEKLEIQRWWSEIIDYERPFTRIEQVSSRRKLTAYVSKYVAKLPDASGGFNLLAYLHGDEFIHPQTGEIRGSLGRWWGVFQSEKLPYAEATELTVSSLAPIHQFKRAARHVWRGVNGSRTLGFSLFVGDAARWLDLFFAIAMNAA